MLEYNKLLEGNKKYSMNKRFEDPKYFEKLSEGQSPKFLWIGCSDSRVPANEITGTESGDIFVHRNIANLVVENDKNILAVLEYAVNVLKIEHIIVCGHYGCGGVINSFREDLTGNIRDWLANIKTTYQKHKPEIESLPSQTEKERKLTELSVIEQVKNLAHNSIIQDAWKERKLILHGWAYGINKGLINDLILVNNLSESPE